MKEVGLASVVPLAHLSVFLRAGISHSLIVRSSPEASVLPSGLNATVPPLSVACSLPVATSHSLIVWLDAPDARVLLSGLKAKEYTDPPPPMKLLKKLAQLSPRARVYNEAWCGRLHDVAIA